MLWRFDRVLMGRTQRPLMIEQIHPLLARPPWGAALAGHRSLAAAALVFAIALALRLAYVLAIDYVPYSDMLVYDQQALSVLAGNGFPATGGAGEHYPLYPNLIAALYGVFGHSYLAVRIGQAMLGALTCLLVVCWARRVWSDRRTAVLAGMMAACYPDLILHAGSILAETLYTFLLTGALLVWSLSLDRRDWRWFAATGLILGLAGLTRSSVAFLMPFALGFQGILLWPHWRRAIASAAVLGVGFVAVWSPLLMRNQVVWGRPLVPSQELGIAIWGVTMRWPKAIG